MERIPRESRAAVKASPIGILPPELLAEIFDHYTTYSSVSPLLLSHVSTLWRRTAITTPRLWRRVSAKVPSLAAEATSAKVGMWLRRAGSFPVHVSLHVIEWSDEFLANSLLENLREHSWHWGRFTLTAASHTIARRVFAYFTIVQRTGMLSRIDLNAESDLVDIIEPPDVPDEEEDMRTDINVIFYSLHNIALHSSHLTELNIFSEMLPYASWGAPTCSDLPHLRTLRIFERGSELPQSDAVSILRILSKCPSLETFSFRGWYAFEPRSNAVGIVHLPHLRELHLAQTFHQRIILSSLYTPQLEVLRLLWLNRPDMLIEDEYEAEFFEEPEDPPEFSQSPYTDVLTGNGMRTLIRRSLPPIKTLDMDFADARSPKDFVWLFAHLPLLETFRIVGSDMSDKVLGALSSPTAKGSWLCPRLTHVDLSRCDIITGQGIIMLAKGRNPPLEDRNAEKECVRPARLVQFEVEACASVDCESVAVKQHIMGDVNFKVERIPSSLIYPEEGLQMPD